MWAHGFKNVGQKLNSRIPLETPYLDHIFTGNFTLSNSIISEEDLIRWNKGFEIFLIDHYAGDQSLASIQKTVLITVPPTLN